MRTTFISLLIISFSLVLSPDAKGQPTNSRELKNSLGMKFVYVNPGKFTMGSPESEPGREAQEVPHEVELTKGFYMSAHEVTVGQFKQFVTDTKFQTDGERDGKGAYGINEAGKIEEMHAKFTWKSPGFEQTDAHPVVSVSWSDAKAFCKWLSEKEKKTYRLPTEAEWEYACRAGTKTAYVHGDDPEGLATMGNGADATARAKFPGWSIGIKAKDGHVLTAPVGQFKANAFGLYDMHGNVWEWCEDWYEPNSYPKEKQVDPTGPATGKAKVQRGGGWSSDANRLRSASRVGRDSAAYRGCYLGFRVVLATADEAPSKEPGGAKKSPAGLRVMNGGPGSSTENSAPLCQAAGIVGHKKITGVNGNRIEDLTPLLEKGEIDAYVWQHISVGPEFPKFLPTLVELGPKHNPNFRVIMQMPWLVHDGLKDPKSPEEYEKTDLAEYQTKMEKYRKQQEAYVDEVNAKAGKRVVFLVPLGDGMLEVRKLIAAGKFPGVTKQSGDNSVLRGDIQPHQGLLGIRLGTYMHFAALYRMSPEGLKFPGKEGDGLTDEQRAILQKLAWDMVSKYPYAGIAKFDAPKTPKEGEKPVPKSGEGPALVPEALKGWKETNDLPADTVVADYNAYIEKLPKAERPGVSNVKYYVDDTGRNAVAVLVNEGDKQWIHLLVYDKQNKRTSVTKFAAMPSEPKKETHVNPRTLKAIDPKLKTEFEYLVFDLGKGVELKLVKVQAKGKTFTIGSSKQEQEAVVKQYHDGKRPATLDFEAEQEVTLTDDYYIGQFEVTRAQFRRFVEETKYVTDAEMLEGGYGYNEETKKFEGRDKKYTWQNTGVSSAGEQHPVTNVSRNDARKFCEWLMKKCDGKIKLGEVRLPGEAEWEFACRAGSTGRFCCGDDDERLAEFANIADANWKEKLGGPDAKTIKANDGHAFAAPVGQFKPNNFGVYDMHGNVWEWCDDFYGKYSALPKERNSLQTKNQGEGRPVLRGGSWGLPPVACRNANRYLVGAGPSRYGAAGFRIVAVP